MNEAQRKTIQVLAEVHREKAKATRSDAHAAIASALYEALHPPQVIGTPKQGKRLWAEDDAAPDAERLGAAWLRLFGEAFDHARAVVTIDYGDATFYLMPNGRIAIGSYPGNSEIYEGVGGALAGAPGEGVLSAKDLRRAREVGLGDDADVKGIVDYLHHYHPGAVVRVADLVGLLEGVEGAVRERIGDAYDTRDEEWQVATDCGDPGEAANLISRLREYRDTAQSVLESETAKLDRTAEALEDFAGGLLDAIEGGDAPEDLAAWLAGKRAELERLARGEKVPAAEVCATCEEPQYNTPSGRVCRNGHGGADTKPSKAKGKKGGTKVA
jgi:hypothetical protein